MMIKIDSSKFLPWFNEAAQERTGRKALPTSDQTSIRRHWVNANRVENVHAIGDATLSRQGELAVNYREVPIE